MFGRFLAFYFRKKTRDRGPHTEEPEPLLLKPPLLKPSLPPAPPAGVAVSTMSDVNRIKKVQSTRAACAFCNLVPAHPACTAALW